MEIHPPAMLFRGRALHSAVDIDAPPMPTASRKREMPRSDNPRPTNTRQTEPGLRSTPRRNSSFESPSLFFLSLSLSLSVLLSPSARSSSFLPRLQHRVAEKRVIKLLRRRRGVESGSSRRLASMDKSGWYTSIPRRYKSNRSPEGMLCISLTVRLT